MKAFKLLALTSCFLLATGSGVIKGLDRPGVSIGSYASEIILEHIARNNAVMRSVHERNHKDLF